ncbi:MAG: hypothetical protein WA532_10865 [Candidatus Korobacteraceae bacterium]
MPARILTAALICLLVLSATAASAGPAEPRPAEPRQAAALWLTAQLHRPVEPAQILIVPESGTLDGCSILRTRPAPTGATALSLRCPDHLLPQLVLLKIPLDTVSVNVPAAAPAAGSNALPAATTAGHPSPTPKPAAAKAPPLVRAGATLDADWRTPALHAEFPVVALDFGAAGSEIRVRIAHGVRVLRARILTAHSVAILEAGA